MAVVTVAVMVVVTVVIMMAMVVVTLAVMMNIVIKLGTSLSHLSWDYQHICYIPPRTSLGIRSTYGISLR